MKIIMLETKQGSPNGIRVETYYKNEEYDIPESLGNVFIKIKVAEKAKITDVADGIKKAKKVIEPEYDKKVVKPDYDKKKKGK